MRWYDCAERALRSKLFVEMVREIKESGLKGTKKKTIAVAMHVYATRANKCSLAYKPGYWVLTSQFNTKVAEGRGPYSISMLATIKTDTLFKYAPYVDRYKALIRKGERPDV
jgi:hypothetical protein